MKRKHKGVILILFTILIAFLTIAITSTTTLINSRANSVVYETNKDTLYYDSSMVLEYIYTGFSREIDDNGHPIVSTLSSFKNDTSNKYSKNYILIGNKGTDSIHGNVVPVDISLQYNSLKLVSAKVSAVVDEKDGNKFIKVKSTTQHKINGKSDKTSTRTVTMLIDQNQVDRPKIYDGNID